VILFRDSNFAESHFIRSGVRQGCVLSAFLFCLAMYPVFARLEAMLGHEGGLYAYSDDVYLLSDPGGPPHVHKLTNMRNIKVQVLKENSRLQFHNTSIRRRVCDKCLSGW